MRKYGLQKAKRTAEEACLQSKGEFKDGVRWIDWIPPAGVHADDVKQVKQKGKGGWLVTITGCIYPVLFCNNGELASIRRALGQPISSGPPNAPLDWPANPQSSSLCHDHNCVNGRHFVSEPEWCNKRRNYCRGTLADGSHDCRMEPACLVPYRQTDKGYDKEGGIRVPDRYTGPLTPATAADFEHGFPLFTGVYDPADRFAAEWARARKKKARKAM